MDSAKEGVGIDGPYSGLQVTLRPATPADRRFVQDVYFETYRWVLERMFGWGSDENESAKIDDFYSEESTKIILVDGQEAGFLSLIRRRKYLDIQCLFLRPAYQRRGIGTYLLRGIMAKADTDGTYLAISTHHINPAKRLYLRLGFVIVYETHYRIQFAYPSDPG